MNNQDGIPTGFPALQRRRHRKQASSDDTEPFAGRHHARYIEEDVPLHIISRIFQGRHLLVPTPVLNCIILGVIGRALEVYEHIVFYAVSFMSNHAHFMLQGPANEVAAFVGFVKREVSRRWGGNEDINWPGTMWDEYVATSLPTAESQERCLAYILGQGVKEGLVERPQDWPGVHAAQALLTGKKLKGRWLNATEYGRAVRAEERKLAENREAVLREEYEVDYEVELEPLPGWQHLSAEARQARVREMVDEIIRSGREARGGRRALGAKEVMRTPRNRRSELPRPPWFEERRRMICWSSHKAPETQAFLRRYWEFQDAFQRASERLRAGNMGVKFPPGAFRPVTYTSPKMAA